MIHCERPECPDWLASHWVDWGEEYSRKLSENRTYRFAWRRYEGQKVSHRLLPRLREMTAGHCAYCDWFPTDVGTDPTIDHFRPKAKFPKEVYHWPNLYLCCRTCQDKDDKDFSEDLLRPDAPDYQFERYFVYNYRDGSLSPNPAASEYDQARALRTIRHLRLNKGARCTSRKRELGLFRRLAPEDQVEFLGERPYRYLLSAELHDGPPVDTA